LWDEFMDELRTLHLGTPPPDGDGPPVSERLAEAYARALDESSEEDDLGAPLP
jgi:hypothetical protein